MARSTCWLWTAVNRYICILLTPLPVVVNPSLSQARSAVLVIACSAPPQAEGQFLSSGLVSSQDVSQHAWELTTLPGWATQRCASAVTWGLLIQGIRKYFYITSTRVGNIPCYSVPELDLKKHCQYAAFCRIQPVQKGKMGCRS